MRILGNAKEDGNGSGGIIVHLNYAEAHILSELQDALEGKCWSIRLDMDLPRDKEIDKALLAVYQFAKANFAINELSQTVEQLSIIVKGKQDKLDEN